MRTTAAPASVSPTEIVAGLTGHPWIPICPMCTGDCSRIELVELVYAFNLCLCGYAPSAHVVQQVYHRDCFLKQQGEE